MIADVREVYAIAADVAKTQERVSLAWSVVPHHLPAGELRADEAFEQAPLGPLPLLGEGGVGGEVAQPGVVLALDQLAHARQRRLRRIVGVADEQPERTAMRPQLLDVEDAQAVRREHALRRHQREVPEMLVIDGVELVLLDEAQQMRE